MQCSLFAEDFQYFTNRTQTGLLFAKKIGYTNNKLTSNLLN